MGYVLDQVSTPLTTLPETVAPAVLACIPAVTAGALQVLPFAQQGDVLQVAMTTSVDWDRVQHLRLLTGLRIQGVVVDPALIQQGLAQWYPDAPPGRAGPHEAAPPDRLPERMAEATTETTAPPIVQVVDHLITTAVQRGASDIHLEPFEQEVRLRYRIDGFLQAQPSLPWAWQAAMVSRIKVLANLDIAEKRRPQDGKIQFTVQGRPIDLRVSTTPTIYGEKVVLRILDRAAVALDLATLGFASDVLAPLRQALARPYGLVLVTGPTGSGKTTTLYAALHAIQAEGINILTVEDPIEYHLPGVNQTQVHPEIGLTFAHVLRSFLRQDPNVILVGEIRDRETAAIAIQAALTGHLVLSSVHTNDAPGAVGRLLDMGIEPFLVASALTLVVAQRLVRRNCLVCRQAVALSPAEREHLRLSAETDLPAWQGVGCPACFGTGYRGRIALAEVMPVSPAIADLMSQRASVQELRRQALQEAMQPLRADGLQKLAQGITSPAEILRETVMGDK